MNTPRLPNPGGRTSPRRRSPASTTRCRPARGFASGFIDDVLVCVACSTRIIVVFWFIIYVVLSYLLCVLVMLCCYYCVVMLCMLYADSHLRVDIGKRSHARKPSGRLCQR